MDQSTMNIQSILSLDLVVIAFAMIPELKKAFDSLIVKINNTRIGLTDESEHLLERQKELREIFIGLLTKRIKFIKDFQKWLPNTKNEMKDIVFDKNMWIEAFEIMSDRIITELHKNYYDFKFVTMNICDFAIKFNDYMYNFAQTNKCDYDSMMYKTKYHAVQSWVTSRFQDKIKFEQEMSNYCLEILPDFLKIVTRAWMESVDEYIQEENDAFDKSDVSFSVELDEKEARRVSYEHRKKNRHYHYKCHY